MKRIRAIRKMSPGIDPSPTPSRPMMKRAETYLLSSGISDERPSPILRQLLSPGVCAAGAGGVRIFP
jgi:hypothetical protein